MDDLQVRMKRAQRTYQRSVAILDEYLEGDPTNINKTRILRELEHRRIMSR